MFGDPDTTDRGGSTEELRHGSPEPPANGARMEGGESMDIRITEIRISLRDDEKLKAFVTITLEGCFVVRGMKIIKGNQGMFVAMPSRRKPDGSFQDICHPINQATREKIEEQILAKYRQELEGTLVQ